MSKSADEYFKSRIRSVTEYAMGGFDGANGPHMSERTIRFGSICAAKAFADAAEVCEATCREKLGEDVAREIADALRKRIGLRP